MTPRRIQLSSWQELILHTDDGPVRLRITSDDANPPYCDFEIEAPPGMRLEIVPLPMEERPLPWGKRPGRNKCETTPRGQA